MKPYHTLFFETEAEQHAKAKELETDGFQVHYWDLTETMKRCHALQVRDIRLKGTKWPKLIY